MEGFELDIPAETLAKLKDIYDKAQKQKKMTMRICLKNYGRISITSLINS